MTPQGVLWLMATVASYMGARWLQRRVGGHPLCNPVALGAAPLMLALWLTQTPYATYAQGGDVLLWWLGPATAALALPAAEERAALGRAWRPLIAATLVGGLVASGAALGIAGALGASSETLRSLAPKSVTTAVALPLSASLGGAAGLTALSVILTGVWGALIGPPLLRRLGLHEPRATGVALGVCAHGIGTARSFQLDPLAGLFAGLGMTLSGLLTSLILPIVARWLGW